MPFRDRIARLARRRASGAPHLAGAPSTVPGDDAHRPSPPAECTPAETQRWNDEWLAYLRAEWQWQLVPHTAYPLTPALPADPKGLLALQLGYGGPLSLYCDADALAGRRVLEMGCGCGNLGKLLGRYVAHYVGTDYSTLALAVARLVSPANCAYVHVADRAGIAPFLGNVDTIVGRYFWIHQNAELAGYNLDFLAGFAAVGARLYADFYWPDPNQDQGMVLRPEDALSRAFPSATFQYTLADVERLIAGRPWRILREEVVPAMQRRYVVLERLAA
jgi:SAM-dependent methyltransferase